MICKQVLFDNFESMILSALKIVSSIPILRYKISFSGFPYCSRTSISQDNFISWWISKIGPSVLCSWNKSIKGQKASNKNQRRAVLW